MSTASCSRLRPEFGHTQTVPVKRRENLLQALDEIEVCEGSMETVDVSLRVRGHEDRSDRGDAGQSSVFSFVDHAHPSTAQHLNDSVVGNGLAYHDPSGRRPVCAGRSNLRWDWLFRQPILRIH
jgi:hypothetical protein